MTVQVAVECPLQAWGQSETAEVAGTVEFVQCLLVPAEAGQDGAPIVEGSGVVRLLRQNLLEMAQGFQRPAAARRQFVIRPGPPQPAPSRCQSVWLTAPLHGAGVPRVRGAGASPQRRRTCVGNPEASAG